MPEVNPFRGYRYNPKKIKNVAGVLSPPYDVISPKEQRALYRKSRYNFVRIDLRRGTKQHGKKGKRFYRAAARELESWIQKQIVLRDAKPCLYVYLQNYRSLSGKSAERLGFLSLMKINPRKVKKHENTLSGPKSDRAALMESTRSQLSPIFGLFRDASGRVQGTLHRTLRKKPEVDVVFSGVRHRFFVEQDPDRIREIRQVLMPKNIYIADGHHRFEVTHQFHKKHARTPGAGYVMTYLCDALRNDFTIHPTHRVLMGLKSGWEERFEKIAHRYFETKSYRDLRSLLAAMDKNPSKRVVIGCFKSGRYSKLTLRMKTRDLDVSILHKYFIDKLLGEDVSGSRRIRFLRDASDAVRCVRSKEAQAAFFLSKMPIGEMIRVSDAGVKLPQKSTYFYPKLLSGLVFYKF